MINKKFIIFGLSLVLISSQAFSSTKKYEEFENKIQKLHQLHAKECAPMEIAFAEGYLNTLKGLKIEGLSAKPQKIDKLTFTNKVKIYLSMAEEKIYSDTDKDGVPCYKEIEQGTNPFENPKMKKKVAKKVNKVQTEKVEKKKGYKPLKVHARIHFDFDKAEIKKDYLPYLKVIVHHLKENKNLKVKIIGFTDNIGSKEYNNKLAYKRAKAIELYLIKNGISKDRIEILGKGKANYLFDNKNELNRFTNRRVEFFVMDTK
jgi:outer membrane protein OmpA-like peptidoglycan-associated protein